MYKHRCKTHDNSITENAVLFVYLALFVLAEVIPGIDKIFGFAIILFNCWLCATNKKHKDIVLFSSFLLGSELMALLNLVVFVIFSPDKLKNILRTEKKIAILLAAIFAVSLICGVFQGTLWNVIGYTAFLSILVLVGVTAYNTMSPDRLTHLIVRFVWIEMVITVLIFLRVRDLGSVDSYYGTIKNAHFYGCWLIMALLVLLYNAFSEGKDGIQRLLKQHGVTLVAMLFMLWITDAKMLLLCAGVGVLAYWAFSHMKKNRVLVFILALYGFVFIVLAALQLDFLRELIYKISPGMARYIYDPGWNGKIVYIQGTFFESLKGFRLFTGYGLGQYGSRVANAFAYDAMWRGDNFINNIVEKIFAPHSIPEYTRYVSYYTQEFLNDIQNRSAILSYPFNSFTAIIGETGLFGVAGFAYILERLFGKNRYGCIIFCFMFMCVFDTYLDNLLCVGPAIMYLVNAAPRTRQKETVAD